MIKIVLSVGALVFLNQCVAQTEGVAEKPAEQPKVIDWDSLKVVNAPYRKQEVIPKEFKTHPTNPYIKDASMAEIFAALPYFKGEKYSERLSVVNKGKALTGSLSENYALGGGTFDKPSVYFFADNGFGEEITITPLFEGDTAIYIIKIKDKTAGKLILDKEIEYSRYLEGGTDLKKIQWVIDVE